MGTLTSNPGVSWLTQNSRSDASLGTEVCRGEAGAWRCRAYVSAIGRPKSWSASWPACDQRSRSGRMKHKLAIVIPYFGAWPVWMNFFIESCRWNRDIDWLLFSDNNPPENRCSNVRHVRLSFADYVSLISEALDIRFAPRDPYKLCDVRPALPFVHRSLLGSYDFVGFGDLDVIYGDLRSFYDDAALDSYDLLSTHANRISGHLCLMRNDDRMIGAFKQIRGWRELFEQDQHAGTDERDFYNVFRGRTAKLASWLGRDQPRCLFREAYST